MITSGWQEVRPFADESGGTSRSERKETRLGPRLALRGKSGAVNTAIKQGPTAAASSSKNLLAANKKEWGMDFGGPAVWPTHASWLANNWPLALNVKQGCAAVFLCPFWMPATQFVHFAGQRVECETNSRLASKVNKCVQSKFTPHFQVAANNKYLNVHHTATRKHLILNLKIEFFYTSHLD